MKIPPFLVWRCLIIGEQVVTEHGGRIDLLGINRDADLIIVELKRGKTSREVVGQVLDYASWVKALDYSGLNSISEDFLGKSLANAFTDAFFDTIPGNVNTNHSILIVASELDDSSERIVNYLASEHDLSINVVVFNFYKVGKDEFLGRAWLMDPVDVQERTEARHKAPWSGYWFVNVGEGQHRNWDDNRKYGFLSAGQAPWYSKAMKRLSEGDLVFAYMKGLGYVGYGKVNQQAKPIREFRVGDDQIPILDLELKAEVPDENMESLENSEWLVGIDWVKTFSRDDARTFKGAFANQNVVCKLRHEPTVEFLKREFEID